MELEMNIVARRVLKSPEALEIINNIDDNMIFAMTSEELRNFLDKVLDCI